MHSSLFFTQLYMLRCVLFFYRRGWKGFLSVDQVLFVFLIPTYMFVRDVAVSVAVVVVQG
jgi:hypothetical protein